MAPRSRRHFIWVPVTVIAVVLLLLGLGRGEWSVVKQHAETLCTACIGLTTGSG